MAEMNPGPMHSPGFSRKAGNAVPRCIEKDDILALNLERERRLLCTDGLLWVTVQNDRNDYLLGADREMHIPKKRKVIMEAEEPSCFQID